MLPRKVFDPVDGAGLKITGPIGGKTTTLGLVDRSIR